MPMRRGRSWCGRGGRKPRGRRSQNIVCATVQRIPAFRVMGFAPARPVLTLRSLEPHAGLITVGELDASFLERALDRFQRSRLQGLARFKARDGARGDPCQLRKLSNPELKAGPR